MMKTFLLPIFVLGLLSGCASSRSQNSGKKPETAAESSGTRMKMPVSEATARQAALAKFPGTVQKSEMETWKGKRYYTFDIVTKSAKKPVEVAVDPQTGQVVWSSNEKHS